MRRNRAQYFIYFNYSTTDNNIFSKDNLCKFRVTFSELFVAEEILKGKQTENCWDYLHKIQKGRLLIGFTSVVGICLTKAFFTN